MTTTVSLPDIIGEYIFAPNRFETGGIQYVGYFEPNTIAPHQTTNLYLFIQNTFNVPAKVTIQPIFYRYSNNLFAVYSGLNPAQALSCR